MWRRFKQNNNNRPSDGGTQAPSTPDHFYYQTTEEEEEEEEEDDGDKDDSELPTSSNHSSSQNPPPTPNPLISELAFLVPFGNDRSNDHTTNNDNNRNSTSHNSSSANEQAPPPVKKGSQVYTGLVTPNAEDEGIKNAATAADDDDHTDNDDLTPQQSLLQSEGVDPWTAYVSSKNLDVNSYHTPLPEYEGEQQEPFTLEKWEEDVARGLLPEDTFAFLATCHIRSKAFLVAVCTMATQLIVLCLLTVDSITFARQDDDLPRNTLSVPTTSVFQVSMSQFLALMIASVSQTDCLQSVMLLHHGYQEHRVRDVLRSGHFRQPKLLRIRWYISIFARFIVGFFTGIVTFLLVVRSETVRDGTFEYLYIFFSLSAPAIVAKKWKFLTSFL